MTDESDTSIDSTDATESDSDVSRRAVLSKSAAGVGIGALQLGDWWDDDSDDGSDTGFGGWWGDGDDGDADPDPGDGGGQRPVVFVHGGAGSATQFESQAMRFVGNGYSEDYLEAFEYDSQSYSGGLLGGLLGGDDSLEQQVNEALDQTIDDVLARTGEEAVYAIGHSLGTSVLGSYLADSTRASKVAKYVDLDGRQHDSLPGGVETLAVWGLGSPDASISGAENVHLDQSHVQLATSEETFAEVYPFLVGEQPDTTSIQPEPADQITLSGRTQLFPSNEVPADLFDGATIEIYEVDPATGQPATEEPLATPAIDADGYWGPVDVDGTAHHEFRLDLASTDQVHHHYRQPELRSNKFVRLLTSRPGEGTDQYVDRGDGHVALTPLRDKEWWGDQGAASDELTVDGTDILNGTTAPRDGRVISPFVFDVGADQQTDLQNVPSSFSLLPFLSAADVYVPAASPPDDTVEVTSTPRDGTGVTRRFAVPNWASSGHRISLYVPDHTQSR